MKTLSKTDVPSWLSLDVPWGDPKVSYYVYVDKTADGVPFYVGKGNQARVLNPARNKKHASVTKKHGLVRHVVFCTGDEGEAYSRERQLVTELNTRCQRGSLGSNIAPGGRAPRGSIPKAVQQRDVNGELLAEFSSIKHAQDATGVWNVCRACKGELKTAGGFKWNYAPGIEPDVRSLQTRHNISKSLTRRPVMCCSNTGVEISRYPSARAAAEVSGIGYHNIVRCCRKPGGTAGGLIWRYA